MKNSRAPGDDDVYVQMLKGEEHETPQHLNSIPRDVFDNNSWGLGRSCRPTGRPCRPSCAIFSSYALSKPP